MKIRVVFLKKVKSTQLTAKKMSETQRFFCVCAEQQTDGYGQRGNKWKSDSKNLAYSIVLPLAFFDNTYHVSVITCVAWLKVLRKFDIDLQFKWSNDLYVNGKKLGGILNEIENDNIINGVGINVMKTPRIGGAYKAVSLYDLNKKIVDNKKLLELFLYKFEKLLDEYKKDGIDKIMDLFKKHILYVGDKVEITFNKKKHIGIFKGINNDGSCNLKKRFLNKKFFSGTLRLWSGK